MSVDAGDSPRRQTPVVGTLTVGKDIDAEQVNQLDGRAWMVGSASAQVEACRDGASLRAVVIRWIEPSLKAHEWREYEVTPAFDKLGTFNFVEGDGWRDLEFAHHPIYRHMTHYAPGDATNASTKPFHHLYGLHGEGFITKGAGGFETHHRGLFVGWNTPFGNFWACGDVDQRHEKYLADRQFAGTVAARDASVTNWIGKDGNAVIRDTREVTTWRPAEDEVILDFDITLESLAGEIPLGGNAHHAGFHFRAADEVSGPDTATTKSVKAGLAKYVYPPDAKLTRDDIWADCPWAACCFSVKDNPYVVMHIDDPQNPRPTTYSTRPYGRFGAFCTPTLSQGKPLHLRYRIVLVDGKTHANPTAEALAPMYQDFVAPPTVTIVGK